jgi:putative transposase
MHVCFKAKYCHKIFDDEHVKRRCEEIFRETAGRYDMEIREIGFDRDHVHLTVDAGPNNSPASMAKALKGNSGYKLLREFPYLKRRYFWGSGLWSPAYYFDSMGDRTSSEIDAYVRNQRKKKTGAKQWSLADFLD